MAVGPLARLIAQVIVPAVAVMARALPAAYAQALQNARKGGVDASNAGASMLRKQISKSEALQVLNLTEGEATAEAIEKVRTRSEGATAESCFALTCYLSVKRITYAFSLAAI